MPPLLSLLCHDCVCSTLHFLTQFYFSDSERSSPRFTKPRWWWWWWWWWWWLVVGGWWWWFRACHLSTISGPAISMGQNLAHCSNIRGYPQRSTQPRVQWKSIALGDPNPDPLRPSVLGRVSLYMKTSLLCHSPYYATFARSQRVA